MHPNDTALNDYVDGSLAPFEQTGVDQHLAGCAACRQTVEDLRDIVRASRELEPLDPPVRAWSRLERAIRLEREHAGQAPGARGVPAGARGFQPSGSGGHDARLKGSRSVWLAGLAAAAVVLLATVVGLRYTPARHDDAPAPGAAGASAAVSAGEAVQSIETERERRPRRSPERVALRVARRPRGGGGGAARDGGGTALHAGAAR